MLHSLRKRNIDAHLSFIGYPNEQYYFAEMKNTVERLGLDKYVSILPPDHDKRTEFMKADFSLLPSESEGLSIAALESQAAGVPCLVSDHLAKDVDIGAAFFLSHNDVEKWADTIIHGVQVDSMRLNDNLHKISSQAYAGKIRNIYEQEN